jgi:hypothetical protein
MERNKRARFVDLANNRVSRTIKDLRLIGNLSNRSAYEYSEEDVRKIVRVLQRELEAMRSRFTSPSSAPESEFRLLE